MYNVMIASYLSLKVFVITELVELAFCLVLGLLCLFDFPPVQCTYFLYRSCRERETSAEFHFKKNTKLEQDTLKVLAALMSFLTTGHE